MKCVEKKEEYTLVVTREEALTLKEALDAGARYRTARAEETLSKLLAYQNSDVGPALEIRRAAQYTQLYHQLADCCGLPHTNT